MKTIKSTKEEILIVNNSKFICNIFKVYSHDEVLKYLNKIKKKYKDATHHCYAYIIDNEIRFSDDNEPSGTAGIQIKDVLTKNDLNYVLCIVTRYFGGIKLGANGLIRAYSKSTSTTLKEVNIQKIVKGTRLEISFPYDISKEIDYILKNENIINKKYENQIYYTIETTNTPLIDSLKSYNKVTIITKKDMNIEI